MSFDATIDRLEAERDEVIRIQLFPREAECAVCDRLIIEPVRGGKGIAMFEGEPVPHDWPDEWGGFPCCETCFAEFERVQANEAERRVWFASKRHAARLDTHGFPGYAGDIV